MKARIVVLEAPTLAAELASWLARATGAAITARGRCALALPGGTSPRAALTALGSGVPDSPVDWSRVDVYFGDERAVPPDDPDSNYRMVKESLLDRLRMSPSTHRMEADRPDLERAAADYARLLPERLDVLLLGMGPDGHTASLFPGSAALDEQRRVVNVVAPKPPPVRLTITPPVIAAAREVAVLASGAEKADMVRRALEGPRAVREVPVQLAARGVWFLDPAAASRLERRS
ncbi:MAG: 6-phosphogluconolactonase [Gemmatimonadales bacterium]